MPGPLKGVVGWPIVGPATLAIQSGRYLHVEVELLADSALL